MRIIIASKNPRKIEAVKEVIQDYSFFSGAEIIDKESDSGVSEQPKSLEEVTEGAINRAKNVFQNCNYSLGLESGLMKVPETITGYMDVCMCAIYDGNRTYLGLSCAFEFPIEITKKIFEEGLDANEAAYRIGLSKNKKIGSSEGLISILTKGRITRKDYTKQAIQMALLQLENPELYTSP